MAANDRAPFLRLRFRLAVPPESTSRRSVMHLDLDLRMRTFHLILGGLIASAALWFVVRIEEEERRKAEAQAGLDDRSVAPLAGGTSVERTWRGTGSASSS